MGIPRVNLDGLGQDEREEVLAAYDDFVVSQAEDHLLRSDIFANEETDPRSGFADDD